MEFKPELSNVKLEECCVESVKDIRRRLAAGKWLQRIIMPVGGLICFFGPSEGAAITTMFSVGTTNWEYFAKATMSVPKVIRVAVGKVAFDETLKHLTGDLNAFWTATYEAFTYH
jgi:hypothetical protein